MEYIVSNSLFLSSILAIIPANMPYRVCISIYRPAYIIFRFHWSIYISFPALQCCWYWNLNAILLKRHCYGLLWTCRLWQSSLQCRRNVISYYWFKVCARTWQTHVATRIHAPAMRFTTINNIGFNITQSDPFMLHLDTQLGYSAGEFQALQLVVLAAFVVVD